MVNSKILHPGCGFAGIRCLNNNLDIKPKKLDDKFDIEIVRPSNNSTIRDNTGSVHVSGRIKPVFKQGLSIQLYIDGIPYKTPQKHSMFALRDIERGEHQIKLVLLNTKLFNSGGKSIFCFEF